MSDNDPPEFQIPEDTEIEEYVCYIIEPEPESLDEQALQEDQEPSREVREALDRLFRQYEDQIPWKDPEQ